MPLSADQSAMLELLLDGGQSYEELADLFGLDESEVRLRARTALAAIGGSDPDKNVPLSDYLLGKADPIDRADAVRHLKEDPTDHALAQKILAGLAEIAPGATLVKLPAEPSGSRFMRKSPTPAADAASTTTSPSTPRPGGFSSQQTRLMAILGGGAVILIAIVLAVTGVFSGDDSSSGDTGSGDTSNASSSGDSSTDLANGTDANGGDTATIPLKAVGGSKGSGKAVIGVGSGDQAYVDINLTGIDPAPKGQAYVVWMLLTTGKGKDQGYPLAPIQTTKKGTFENRFPVDSQILPVVARTQSVNISLAKITDIEAEIKKAAQAGSPIIDRVGDTILDGVIPKSAQTQAPATGTTSPDTSTAPDTSTDSTTSTPSTTTPSTSTPDTSTGG